MIFTAKNSRTALLAQTESASILDSALRFATENQTSVQLGCVTFVRRTVAANPARFSANACDGGTGPC